MSEQRDQKVQESAKRTGARIPALPAAIAVISAIIFLDVNFLLNGWAMSSPANMTIDHMIIFTSGAVFGGSLLAILRSRK